MLVRVALGRQIKERPDWVDQAEPRRFLVSFDAESDSYAAGAGKRLASGFRAVQSTPLLNQEGHLPVRCGAGWLLKPDPRMTGPKWGRKPSACSRLSSVVRLSPTSAPKRLTICKSRRGGVVGRG